MDWLKVLNIFKEGLYKENNEILGEIKEIKLVMNEKC